MIKQEVTELKGLYKVKECTVSRIAGCCINPKGEVFANFTEDFLDKEEGEIHNYLEIFKKGLAGKVGRELNTLHFLPEATHPMQDFLQKIIVSKLKDKVLLEIFWERVIKYYKYDGNTLFLLLHNAYDIPGRGKDNFINLDTSDEVYEYISFYICPVELEDGGLCSEMDVRQFIEKNIQWCVKPPVYSFLYPSFENRSADLDLITVYTKKTDGSMNGYTRQLLQAEPEIGFVQQ